MLEKLRAALKATTEKMQLIISRSDNGFSAEDRTEFDALAATSKLQKDDLQRAEIAAGLVVEVGTSAGRRADVTGGTDRKAADPWAGFQSGAHFVSAVRLDAFGTHNPLLDGLKAAAGSGVMGENSQDGYMAPPALSKDFISAIDELEDEDFGAMCDIEPTSASSVDVERDDNLTWTSGQVTARRRDEGDTMNGQKVLPPGVTNIKPEAMYIFVKVTDELRDDAPRLISRLTTKSAAAFVYKRNTELMEGTGVGQALGILSAGNGALVSVAKDSGQAADTVTIGNVNSIWDRVLPMSKRRGVWMCGAGVVSALTNIGANSQNLFMPQGGLSESRFPTLLGRPIMETEFLPAIGDQNDLIFVDWNGYKIIERQTVELARSIHFLFDKGEEAFRWTTRWNGLPRLKAPLARNKATAFSMSHFVRLEERA